MVCFVSPDNMLAGGLVPMQQEQYPERTIYHSKQMLACKFNDPVILEGRNETLAFQVQEDRSGNPEIVITFEKVQMKDRNRFTFQVSF
jgi:hypothetical protein